jgi:IS5 family transposase
MEKVPDAKTLVRLGQAIGAEAIGEVHNRLVAMAQERRVVRERKMRVDTTVVESNIHYPTDSSLLNDGARVLTRTVRKIEQKAGGLKKQVRNRMRSVTRRVIAIAHALRHKGPEGEQKRRAEYGHFCISRGGFSATPNAFCKKQTIYPGGDEPACDPCVSSWI